MRLGFEEDRRRDHIYFSFFDNDEMVVYTKMSHGTGDISKRLLSRILRYQIFLTREEFKAALQGQLSREDYIEILRNKGLIG